VLGTPNAIAVAERLNKLESVMFFPISGFSQFYHGKLSQRVFTLLPSYESEIKQLTDLAFKNGARKIAVVYTSNLYGFDVYNAVKEKAQTLKFEFLRFPVNRNDSIKSIADQIVKSDPDAVIIAVPEEHTRGLVNEFLKKKFYPALYGEFFSVLPIVFSDMEENEADKFEGVYVGMFIPTLDENYGLIKEYKKAVSKYKPGGFSNYPELQGYFMGRALVQILSRVGTWNSSDELIKQVETIKDLDDVGLPEKISYGPNDHVGLTKVFIYQLKNQRIVPVKR
jgi:branched-chain amino acid transport system substrate-binding protein